MLLSFFDTVDFFWRRNLKCYSLIYLPILVFFISIIELTPFLPSITNSVSIEFHYNASMLLII